MSWQTPENLSADDIPSTLNATTFGGAIGMSGTHVAPTGSNAGIWRDSSGGVNFNGLYGQFFSGSSLTAGWNNTILYTTKQFQFFGVSGLINNDQSTRVLSICSGPTSSQANTASINIYGNSHASKPGDAEYYTGTASGADHSFFDNAAAEQLRVSEHGVRVGTLLSLLAESTIVNGVSSTGGYWAISGGSTLSNAANSRWHGSAHATYPGAHQQFAPLSTRAASTAFAVCPVATEDTARCELHDNAAGTTNCVANVDSAGTVTFLSGSDAKYVNSSSPGAAEIGVYVSAGVLYCKPGSSFTGKIASFSRIGKA